VLFVKFNTWSDAAAKTPTLHVPIEKMSSDLWVEGEQTGHNCSRCQQDAGDGPAGWGAANRAAVGEQLPAPCVGPPPASGLA
jgi:hypothetical protein